MVLGAPEQELSDARPLRDLDADLRSLCEELSRAR
jgi:hypothetical protein